MLTHADPELVKDYLIKRIELLANKPPSSGCTDCYLEFSSNDKLMDHLWTMHQKKTIACELCQSMFGRKKFLFEHFTRVHHLGKQFKCSTCAKIFGRKYEMERHVKRTHASNFVYEIINLD